MTYLLALLGITRVTDYLKGHFCDAHRYTQTSFIAHGIIHIFFLKLYEDKYKFCLLNE